MDKEEIINKIKQLTPYDETAGFFALAWAIVYLAKAIEERPIIIPKDK